VHPSQTRLSCSPQRTVRSPKTRASPHTKNDCGRCLRSCERDAPSAALSARRYRAPHCLCHGQRRVKR
jgi:hypothetical protein